MKIQCERCSAQYDLDENRIPPSGMTMKCPACLHTLVVKRNGAAPAMPKPPAEPAPPPPKPREIELSSFADDEGPTQLPPAAPGLEIPTTSAFTPDEIDLPAPVDPDHERDVIDLPAPKAAGRSPAIRPPRPPAIPPSLERDKTREDIPR